MTRIDTEKIDYLIEHGFITRRYHPSGQLVIYNYTAKTQYKNYWTEETIKCRGLICDIKGNIIARPFKKFFNLSEYQSSLPDESFEVYDKLDGSLGILYFFKGAPYIASRGSFDSPHAMIGSKILREQFKSSIPLLDKAKTYLFEIIHPQCRVVVDYKEEKNLMLLGVIDTGTGAEYELQQYTKLGFPIVDKIKAQNIENLKQLDLPNKEGFVIKFQNGLRLKLKFSSYIKLHSIVSKTTNLTIWDALRQGKSLEKIIAGAPDELFTWVEELVTNLLQKFKKIEQEARHELEEIKNRVTGLSRKHFALEVSKSSYKRIVFAMLDNKDYNELIWEMLKPSKVLSFRLKHHQ